MQASIGSGPLNAVALLPACNERQDAATWASPGFVQSESRNDARREYIRLNSRMAAA
jgi:hypothetical protein